VSSTVRRNTQTLGMIVLRFALCCALPAGMAGGAVANPVRALAQLMASMHHPHNHSVAVKGFYDRWVGVVRVGGPMAYPFVGKYLTFTPIAHMLSKAFGAASHESAQHSTA
jgi:hypothetical protein